MDDQAFLPGTPEVTLAEQATTPLWLDGKRAKIGSLVLTNDRLLFATDHVGGGDDGLAQLIAAPLELLAEAAKRADEVAALSEISSARVVPRRLVADLYEFTLVDTSILRVGRRLGEQWKPTIRRLLTERHGRSVIDEGTAGWRVE